MRNILFYSSNCKLCQHLIFLLKNEQFIQYFRLYCVDYDLDNCPVDAVPTMLVSGLKQPLKGNDTLRWVNQAKFIRQQWVANLKQNIIRHNMMRMMMQNMKGPLGYSNQEMNGFSDEFAYTDVDKAVAHVFFGYGDEKKHAIFTAEEMDKIRKGESEQLVKKLTAMRNQDDKVHEEYNEKDRLAKIIKHNRESEIRIPGMDGKK